MGRQRGHWHPPCCRQVSAASVQDDQVPSHPVSMTRSPDSTEVQRSGSSWTGWNPDSHVPQRKGTRQPPHLPSLTITSFYFPDEPSAGITFWYVLWNQYEAKATTRNPAREKDYSTAQIKHWPGWNSCPGHKKQPLQLCCPGIDWRSTHVTRG